MTTIEDLGFFLAYDDQANRPPELVEIPREDMLIPPRSLAKAAILGVLQENDSVYSDDLSGPEQFPFGD
jgi:hypothetical protein